MSSCIYILDENLEPLISKNIKSIPNLRYIAQLFKRVYEPASPPITTSLNWHFIRIKRDSLIFLSAVHTSDYDCDIMCVISFLDQFHLLLKKFLETPVLDRNMILDNVLLIMELFEETIDFGIVQSTESSILKDYVRIKINMPDSTIINQLRDASAKDSEESDNEAKKKSKRVSGMPDLYKYLQISKSTNEKKTSTKDTFDEEGVDTYNSFIANTTVMPISWRTKGIHYGKNEFFLDVIERVQYFMDFEQGIIRTNLIHGQIFCKSYLSGMPKLKIAINKLLKRDAQFISNSKFHQCVSLESLNEKEIQFIPPDGDFVLCKYELKRHVNDPPMLKLSSYEVKAKIKKYKVQILVTIETHFKGQNSTSGLSVKVPLSQIFKDYEIDLRKPARFKSSTGNVLFNLSEDFLLWEVGAMKGGHGETKLSMTAEFALFNKEEYEKEVEELRNSMNPPPIREGPKLEELYKQIHEDDVSKTISLASNLVTMRFEVPYCTCSGLKVEYLKIEEEQLQYQSFPWVRYKTVSDEEYAYLV
ncbi:hypothetical protein HG535_0G03630 [Zygotorulaspora mrakii]|uniref:MHD domain-containing protein n=1 Tax=Zygotorulaspora mrakii TaxID=42260 RepID=A0A7H9B7G3_ZYGMR|nr:uncharacterized protein HG535_0G03630 [Zygotorulaspora mrakii]QLG74480.1 hypothetical protein HG535_0G03630 [Zygotorulaspora mrakii]